MKHYYPDIPQLGNIAISRHAQERMEEQGITQTELENALFNGERIDEDFNTTWMQKSGIRLVIINRPEPFRGAKLVKTVYRVKAQERAR